jgi:hypothetical protein
MLILTRKFKVSRVDGGGGLSPDRSTGQGENVRRNRLAEFGVPVEFDFWVVPGAANFVRIFAIVRLGREVDEENFIGGDGFEAVKDSWRDMDQDTVMFANNDAVGLSVSGAFRAGVIKADLGHTVDDRHAVGLFLVGVPSFDDARVDGAEVSLAEASEVGVVLPEDFHDATAVVAVLREGKDFQAVEHGISMEDWR